MTSKALRALIDLLDLEPIEVNIFRGVSPKEDRQRVFGGQVAGQALVAAGRTVAQGTVHSLHAYFLRPGDPNIPILYDVDRIRDGRSFTTRRVVAIQHGRAIFNLSASFHVDEPGPDHQLPMPDVPDPESLATFKERMEPFKETLGDWYDRPRPIDTRYITDEPLLHACVVAYASDLTLLDTTTLPHALSAFEDHHRLMMASLDHAMWFHRPFRADEWLLYDMESPSASGARGFARGSIYTRDGALVVSVAQEGLVRPLDVDAPAGADAG